MNTYEIEQIDRQGNPIDTVEVTADTFTLNSDSGALWFYRRVENGKQPVENQTVALFAPGTWSMVTLLDQPEQQTAVNAITHQVASEEETKRLLEGMTITTANDGYPITGSAIYNPDNPNSFPTAVHNVYNQAGITRAEVQAEVAQMMRQLD